jgi:hypothetical protein
LKKSLPLVAQIVRVEGNMMYKELQRMNDLLNTNHVKLRKVLTPELRPSSVSLEYDKGSIYVDSYGFVMNENILQNQKLSIGLKVYQDLNTGRALLGQIGDQIEATQIFSNIINKNYDTAKTIIYPPTFKGLVQKNGVWDYKNRSNHLLGKIHIDGLNETTLFKFYDMRMRSTDFGNFHFAIMALSTFLPWSEEFILQQAGEAQIRDGTSKREWQNYTTEMIGGETITVLAPPYGDDPIDQFWIKKGFVFYKNNFPSIRP